MEQLFNVAVTGCGYWGPNLIRNFRSLPNCVVKKACDPSSERLGHMTRLYPELQPVSQFEEIVNDDSIDAVAIATPVASHYDLARRSLLAGKHTFIEKPMASSAQQCMELNDIAKSKNLTLMVGHTFLYSSAVRRIKEIVDSGEIGEILYISARRLNLGLFQKDINVFWDLAPHDISIILYIMNEVPLGINCHGKAHFTAGIEDVTTLILNFSNGGYATIHSSWIDPNKVREMTFVGSKKMIVYDDNAPLEKIKIYDKRVQPPPHYETFADFYYSYHYGDIHTPYLQQVEPLKVECQHFLDCIAQKTTPLTSGENGLQVVQILEAAARSIGNGGGKVELASPAVSAKLSALRVAYA